MFVVLIIFCIFFFFFFQCHRFITHGMCLISGTPLVKFPVESGKSSNNSMSRKEKKNRISLREKFTLHKIFIA